ncbi:SoxAX cytochrome complex subunit A [Rubrivivax sp. A210]|uniref:sulfur oxidation c-type cytochrome SoxA n=1 Tax=Rubrivivax sp. A210 TaxID=2772301 RepID=UPI001917B1C6|nr:sulfur oxidation c-type cytochrome SoxA [Rubrivivax sp. A210]CAD5374515.1 SoxAX cytochrome complex subunit A [Rubrivivax sp. A210]
MRVLLAACALLACGLAQAQPARRPGVDFMSPALQALQRDDTQNPGQLWVAEGRSRWTEAGANGRRCADCHAAPEAMDGVAARYPAWDERLARPLTLAGRIAQCRQRHQGEAAEGADGPAVLALSAWLAHRSRGRPLAPPDDARLMPWSARGEALWRQRFGQLNLACAHCHDERAGLRLGGAAIPQGHPTGYPIYRLEWQGLGSLQRRLRGCLAGVRAEPFAAGADEWLALEVYLARRAAGMVLEGVALRP